MYGLAMTGAPVLVYLAVGTYLLVSSYVLSKFKK